MKHVTISKLDRTLFAIGYISPNAVENVSVGTYREVYNSGVCLQSVNTIWNHIFNMVRRDLKNNGYSE